MFLHTFTIGFVAYFCCVFQPTSPVEIIPVEEVVEDSGALSTSLRVVPIDFRQDQTFEKLYKVVGSDDVYIRRAGGLRAVFRYPVYVESEGGSIPLVPAGTIYCIGQVTPRVLHQLGVTIEPLSGVEKVVSQQEQPVREHTSPRNNILFSGSIRFVDDETYRRQRLASFVLNIALSTGK